MKHPFTIIATSLFAAVPGFNHLRLKNKANGFWQKMPAADLPMREENSLTRAEIKEKVNKTQRGNFNSTMGNRRQQLKKMQGNMSRLSALSIGYELLILNDHTWWVTLGKYFTLCKVQTGMLWVRNRTPHIQSRLFCQSPITFSKCRSCCKINLHSHSKTQTLFHSYKKGLWMRWLLPKNRGLLWITKQGLMPSTLTTH